MYDGTDSLVPEALEYLDPSECSYDEWIRVGMALKYEGYDVSAWDEWSARDSRPGYYKPGEVASKWAGFGDRARNVGGGSIVATAVNHGFRPEGRSVPIPVRRVYAPYVPKDRRVEIDGLDLDALANLPPGELENPVPCSMPPVEQTVDYLSAVFEMQDQSAICKTKFDCRAVIPAQAVTAYGMYGTDLIGRYKNTVGEEFDIRADDNGCFVMVNPYDGGEHRKTENVTHFRHCVIESDTVSMERQLELITALRLPVSAIVDSGNKSYHAIVRIDARDEDEFSARVRFTMDVCAAAGLKPDEACKNANRLTRLPGFMRGERMQRLVALHNGFDSWREWYSWIVAQTTATERKRDSGIVIKKGGIVEPPRRAPVFIDGILRYGHKGIITSSGKAGKTYLMMELGAAVCTGTDWIGFECEQGQVLFVDPELDESSALKRMHDICVAKDLDMAQVERNLSWIHLRGRATGIDQLADKLCEDVEFGSLSLIVIDSIFKLFEGNENDAADVKRFWSHVDRITAATGAAVFLTHHTGKGAKGDMSAIERGRGSSVWGDDPDAPFSLIEIFPPDGEESQLPPGARAFLLEDSGLREFPSIEPVHVIWNHPVHMIDERGVTDGWTPRSSVQIGGKKSGEVRRAKAADAAEQEEAAILALMTERSRAEGRNVTEVTAKDAADACGKHWNTIKNHVSKWQYLEVVSEGQRAFVRMRG